MLLQKHYYGLNHLHYITRSIYRRARFFHSERFKRHQLGGSHGTLFVPWARSKKAYCAREP